MHMSILVTKQVMIQEPKPSASLLIDFRCGSWQFEMQVEVQFISLNHAQLWWQKCLNVCSLMQYRKQSHL